MKKSSVESGFALALLLWMIAGMSLMVTAVIHFAQSDIQMAELRLAEAKGRAVSRGTALLAIRDQMFSTSDGEAGAEGDYQPFRREYVLMEGIAASATIREQNAYTSLNDAGAEELAIVLEGMGRMSAGQAMEMAEQIVNYRDISSDASLTRIGFEGFKAREELLAIPGFSRQVYDLVKDFIHPYGTGSLDHELAPESVSALYTADAGSSGGSRSPNAQPSAAEGGPTGGKSNSGPVTFDAIWEQKRRDSMGGGMSDSAQPVEVTLKSAAGQQLRQRVWVSGSGKSILRAEPPIVAGTRPDAEL